VAAASPASPSVAPTLEFRLVPASRRVLIVGSGGREHALAWKLSRDGADVLVAPGNAGTALVGENVPVAATDIPGLIAVARSRGVDLTVVGPEAPLVAGIVDEFTAAGLRIFGPTKRAAQLEGSKSFCKQVLHRGDVPTAMYREFRSTARAREYLEAREDVPVVVKADGLAAGKGVFVCDDRAAALEAVRSLAEDPQFAAAADAPRSLAFAKEIVQAKVANQRTLLRRNAADLPERVGDEFAQALRDGCARVRLEEPERRTLCHCRQHAARRLPARPLQRSCGCWRGEPSQSRCRCGQGQPSPGADVGRVSPVPVQMWAG
jgi:hypothetical protein